MKKSNLDEMQEQALLRIEHNGCWLAFWGLLAAMTVQQLLGAEGKQLIGEWIVFMALALYLTAGCLRHGIWDRRMKPRFVTNLASSLVAGLFVAALAAATFRHNARSALDLVLIGAVPGVITFALCLIALSICTAAYKKRREQLDRE